MTVVQARPIGNSTQKKLLLACCLEVFTRLMKIQGCFYFMASFFVCEQDEIYQELLFNGQEF